MSKKVNEFFYYSEFASPDVPNSGTKMHPKFLDKLYIARAMAGIPFTITSGYRSRAHNKKVGGVPNSSHLKGVACDIVANNSKDRGIILVSLLNAGFTRIGISDNFIHVDIDNFKPQNVIWLY